MRCLGTSTAATIANPMCTRYTPPDWAAIEREWLVGARNQPPWPDQIFPRSPGPFIRRARDASRLRARAGRRPVGPDPLVRQDRQAHVPDQQRAHRGAGGQGQLQGAVEARPALHHPGGDLRRAELGERQERLVAASAAPTARRGAWPACGTPGPTRPTGEVHESYTMLTLNADAHPLMSRMHKPDPKLGRRPAGQAQRDPDRARRRRPVAGRTVEEASGTAAACARRTCSRDTLRQWLRHPPRLPSHRSRNRPKRQNRHRSPVFSEPPVPDAYCPGNGCVIRL